MLRRVVLVATAASAAAANCGGSLSMDPRYCTGPSLNPATQQPWCDSANLQVGDKVPLRVRMTNSANYEDFLLGETIYVPGLIKGGKMIQIVFACFDPSCASASPDILSYEISNPGETDPNLFVPVDPPVWDPDFAAGQIVGDQYPGGGSAPAKFVMGPCPADQFKGIQHPPCSGADQMKACGCITISQPGFDIQIPGDVQLTLGQIFMKATTYHDAGGFVVHTGADQGILMTEGGICTPNELTASGTGTAQAEYSRDSPPPPPPPPSPPPPPPPPPPPNSPAVCLAYNKCHRCTELPGDSCIYYGVTPSSPEFKCYSTCAELLAAFPCDSPDDPNTWGKTCWIFPKKWGACSSMCPVSVSKDPHLHLPHGGRADFRGKDNTVFNLLSAKDVSLNVRFEASDFAWAKRLVHGTKMAAAYWVLRTASGKVLTIEFQSVKFDPVAIVREKGHRDVEVRPGQPAVVVDDVQVAMLDLKTLTVVNKKWRFSASSSPYPFGKKEVNKDKVLLDVAIQPLYAVDADVVAPHGIIGQAYDGDELAVDGKIDSNRAGETTTEAQAEGAIEGSWEDYIVATPFATDFKYSRFDATAAPHRDVSKLSGAKKAATSTVAGASDKEDGAAPVTLAA